MGKYFEKEALSTGAKWGLGLGAAAVLAPAAAVGAYAAGTHLSGRLQGRMGVPRVGSYMTGPWGASGWKAGNKARKKMQAKQMASAEAIARKQLKKEYGEPKLAARFNNLGKALGIGAAVGAGTALLIGGAAVTGAQYATGKAMGRLGAPGLTKYFGGPAGIIGYNRGAKKRRVAKAKKKILTEEYGIK